MEHSHYTRVSAGQTIKIVCPFRQKGDLKVGNSEEGAQQGCRNLTVFFDIFKENTLIDPPKPQSSISFNLCDFFPNFGEENMYFEVISFTKNGRSNEEKISTVYPFLDPCVEVAHSSVKMDK